MHQDPAYCSAHVARCAEAIRHYRGDAFYLLGLLTLLMIAAALLGLARGALRDRHYPLAILAAVAGVAAIAAAPALALLLEGTA